MTKYELISTNVHAFAFMTVQNSSLASHVNLYDWSARVAFPGCQVIKRLLRNTYASISCYKIASDVQRASTTNNECCT